MLVPRLRCAKLLVVLYTTSMLNMEKRQMMPQMTASPLKFRGDSSVPLRMVVVVITGYIIAV